MDGQVSETEEYLISLIKTEGKEKNYELIEYLNDVNREYTEVLVEQNINGVLDTAYAYGASIGTGSDRFSLDRFDSSTGYYLYDPRGSVTGITNESGQLYQSYRYSVNGEITFGAPQYENEYTYNGESYNPNIQSQYLRARYYAVVTAGFLTEDSYLGDINEPLTLNRYNYCISSPLNYQDPSGNAINLIAGAAVGIIAGIATYAMTGDADAAWIVGATSAVGVATFGASMVAMTAAATTAGTVATATVGKVLVAGLVSGAASSVTEIAMESALHKKEYTAMEAGGKVVVDGLQGAIYSAGFYGAGKALSVAGNKLLKIPVVQKVVQKGAGLAQKYLGGVVNGIKDTVVKIENVYQGTELAALENNAKQAIGKQLLKGANAIDAGVSYLGGKVLSALQGAKNVACSIFGKGSSAGAEGGGAALKPDELLVRDSIFLDADGNIDWDTWAPNGGRVPGTIQEGQTLEVGTIIDRYGNPYGKYTSPVGVPYEQRALPYIENPNAYHKYEVLKPIDNVTISQIAEAFNQSGGGM